MPRPYIHDTYAPLNHKETLGGTRPPGAATWVDDVDARRLAAYTILAAYRDNVARYHLPSSLPDDAVRKHREYGHAALLVAAARSLVLGEVQTVVVPAAADLDDDATTADQQAQARAAEFDAWLQRWATAEHLLIRLLEGEENACGDGDAVYALGWDTERGRPSLRTYDPGFYFPVVGDGGDDFPDAVHIAWEYQAPDGRTLLRRITWRLTPIDMLTDPDGLFLHEPGATRRLPWQVPGEDQATSTCLYSDVTYDLGKLKPGQTVYTLPTLGPAVWATQAVDTDLGIDFLPVVHVPCDAAGARHFGRSVLLRVAQIIDDLAGADTDLQANSVLAGSAPTVVKGGAGDLPAGPGARWDLPEGGDAQILDTSRNLDALIKYDTHLLDQLAVNSQIAASLLGRVEPNEVPSGYALELGFAATRNLIREMRLVRDAKLPLIPKFAMRLAQVHGVLPAGPTPAATIALGPYLPADKPGAVEHVTKLLTARAISTRTGVQVLVEAGFPIDDADAEVRRIDAERFDAAVQLVDATGDVAAARRLLGLPDEVLPELPVPALGG